jgi:hypothetical protein
MKLESQVTSLELSKRLKELGVKQDAEFIWKKLGKKWYVMNIGFSVDLPKTEFSAFTVAELGEMFDREMKIHSGKTVNCPELYYCSYLESNEEGWNKVHWHGADTEAGARAKMLIYLLENNLVGEK